jgi:uncharacterized coiled-coil protein SlyX
VSEFDEKAAQAAGMKMHNECIALVDSNPDSVAMFREGARWQHSQLSARVAELEERVAFYSEQRDNMQQAALELGPKIDELQQKLAVAEQALEDIASTEKPAFMENPGYWGEMIVGRAAEARAFLARLKGGGV